MLCCLFLCAQISAQKNFSVDVMSGIGFTNNLRLVNEHVSGYGSLTTHVGINYRKAVYKNVFAVVGLASELQYSFGQIGLSNFTVTSVTVSAPLLVGYEVSKKLNFAAGVSISNNKDIAKFDSRGNYNYRTSMILKGYFNFKSNLDFIATYTQGLSATPNALYVNRPKTVLLLGVSFKLF